MESQLRQRLAQTSARLMVEDGVDYQTAKSKAASQLGVPNTRQLPSNLEIEAEIMVYQRLFYAETQPVLLRERREVARQLMLMLMQFDPRLAGPVLEGTAHQHSEVLLHVFCNAPEELAIYLMDRHIPYELSEKRYRTPQAIDFPCYRFVMDEVAVCLVAFSSDDIRWSPPSPVDGKPMRRADLRALEKLLAENEVEKGIM